MRGHGWKKERWGGGKSKLVLCCGRSRGHGSALIAAPSTQHRDVGTSSSSPGTPVLLLLCLFKGHFVPLPQEEHCN